MSKIKVIIPAYIMKKEPHTLLKKFQILRIIIISNNSTDTISGNSSWCHRTSENRKGYGYACLKGMEYISNQEIKPDIVVF
jgi:hypothetical protein